MWTPKPTPKHKFQMMLTDTLGKETLVTVMYDRYVPNDKQVFLDNVRVYDNDIEITCYRGVVEQQRHIDDYCRAHALKEHAAIGELINQAIQ